MMLSGRLGGMTLVLAFLVSGSDAVTTGGFSIASEFTSPAEET